MSSKDGLCFLWYSLCIFAKYISWVEFTMHNYSNHCQIFSQTEETLCKKTVRHSVNGTWKYPVAAILQQFFVAMIHCRIKQKCNFVISTNSLVRLFWTLSNLGSAHLIWVYAKKTVRQYVKVNWLIEFSADVSFCRGGASILSCLNSWILQRVLADK